MCAMASTLPAIGKDLARAVAALRFAAPVTHVYNPLEYAWSPHAEYLRRYGTGRKKTLWLGMNPGPFGMAQTGIPFGDVDAVRRFLGIEGKVGKPPVEHPRRPILGFACPRGEVSGRRLWGFIEQRFGTASAFFADNFVANYCPLVFMDASGRNITPDKLPAAERAPLFAACDRALARMLELFAPDTIVAVGQFAAARARAVAGDGAHIRCLPHPSPASPLANRGWAEAAARVLDAEAPAR